MANTYHQIILQTVFAVKYRKALLDKAWRRQVFGVMGNIINEHDCKTLIVNGVEDHVHCLFGLKPNVSVSDLMQHVKARSSKFINDNNLTRDRFEWQKGFGVFSYHKILLPVVYKYVENQETHHRETTFLEEYLDLLKTFDIEFEDAYIFQEPV